MDETENLIFYNLKWNVVLLYIDFTTFYMECQSIELMLAQDFSHTSPTNQVTMQRLEKELTRGGGTLQFELVGFR